MLASTGTALPTGDGWTFEPKYDGIRVLAVVSGNEVALLSRNGNDKTAAFPEIADGVRALSQRARRSLVLDGEIVGLRDGRLGRFQDLQGRIHRRDLFEDSATDTPVTLLVFDLLVDGVTTLTGEPWTTRRQRLGKLFVTKSGARRRPDAETETLRLGETSGDGRRMLEAARREGWEGIIAKRVDAHYEMGQRSHSWMKLKVEHEQEFVVGGYTEPRNTRQYFGALLLGYYDGARLLFAGSCGGGFTEADLRSVYSRLRPLTRPSSPYSGTPPKTPEKRYWVEPKLVVQVRFNEWTSDGRLRHPVYLGLRDDADPRQVRREPNSLQAEETPRQRMAPAPSRASPRALLPAQPLASSAARTKAARRARSETDPIVEQLESIERDGGGNGVLTLGPRSTLDVSKLGKVFFPATRSTPALTKGDLMRYYAAVAPQLVPTLADRPLVLKRFPNGITGQSFYQQKAPDQPPAGVRVERVENGDVERRLVGGDLLTLLYLVQLGAISVDPWHAHLGSLDTPDYTIIDLDPGPKASFQRVVDVAHWVKEELDTLQLRAALKTSGATGLHIVVPLVKGTPETAARLAAELIATAVAQRHPKEATIGRVVRTRAPNSVYVDYLQNIRGKTVAGVYSARALPGAPVSTPLRWEELTDDLSPMDFTIENVPERIAHLGDLWGRAMSRPNHLTRILELQERRRPHRVDRQTA